MLIRFDEMREVTIPHLNDGEGAVSAKMYAGPEGKVMLSRLPIGASIGTHRHTESGEVDYVLSGSSEAVCDGVTEALEAGCCHVCRRGASHSIVNTGDAELILFTVVG